MSTIKVRPKDVSRDFWYTPAVAPRILPASGARRAYIEGIKDGFKQEYRGSADEEADQFYEMGYREGADQYNRTFVHMKDLFPKPKGKIKGVISKKGVPAGG